MIDLNKFLPPSSGATLTEATFINDRGEIGVWAVFSNGDNHVALLIPGDGNDEGLSGRQHQNCYISRRVIQQRGANSFSLRWSGFDMDTRTLMVTQTAYNGKFRDFGKTKKSARWRCWRRPKAASKTCKPFSVIPRGDTTVNLYMQPIEEGSNGARCDLLGADGTRNSSRFVKTFGYLVGFGTLRDFGWMQVVKLCGAGA